MQNIYEKAKNIRLLICDMDGVLTDGSLYYGEQGELFKGFHCHDGFGLQLLMKIGIEVAVITTAETPIVTQRTAALKIPHVYSGKFSKITAFEDLLSKLKLEPHQVAAVGDDLPDLPMVARSGLGIAVANAVMPVKNIADWVTSKRGGEGAVREICELIIEAQNATGQLIEHYLNA